MIAFLDKLYFRFNGDTYKKSLVNRGIAYLIRAFANYSSYTEENVSLLCWTKKFI